MANEAQDGYYHPLPTWDAGVGLEEGGPQVSEALYVGLLDGTLDLGE